MVHPNPKTPKVMEMFNGTQMYNPAPEDSVVNTTFLLAESARKMFLRLLIILIEGTAPYGCLLLFLPPFFL